MNDKKFLCIAEKEERKIENDYNLLINYRVLFNFVFYRQ